MPHAWAWAAALFVLSWYAQIHPGHMMLEGRRPALLDSFFQVGPSQSHAMESFGLLRTEVAQRKPAETAVPHVAHGT